MGRASACCSGGSAVWRTRSCGTSWPATGSRVLAEASPRDRVWGIGLAAGDERAWSPECWQGLNLLGFALMEVRHELSAGR